MLEVAATLPLSDRNITAVRAENAEKETKVKVTQDAEPYSANGNAISPARLGEVSFLGGQNSTAFRLFFDSIRLVSSFERCFRLVLTRFCGQG